MDRVTYQDLIARFGNNMAFDLLITIEKLANARSTLYPLDENTRLQRALEALNGIDFSQSVTSLDGTA